jgi:Calx-beta domain
MPSNIGTNFGELDESEYTGPIVGGIKADSLIWDCTKNFDPTDFSLFDGGAGNDSLTLKLTQEQLDAMMAEIHVTQPGAKIKPDGTLIGDGSTFSGNNWQSLSSLGITVKNWETVKVDVLKQDALAISVSDAPTVIEGGGAVFKVNLNHAYSYDVIIDYSTSDGSAKAMDGDFASNSGTIVIPAGSLFAYVPVVHTIDDSAVESTETFKLDIGNAHSSLNVSLAANVVDAQGVGTILDNDVVPAPHLEVVKVLDFEQDNVDSGNGFVDPNTGLTLFTQTVPIDWNSSGNLPVEIQGGLSGYGGHTNYGAGAVGTPYAGNPLEDQYLDTAQSSGNINIRTESGIGVNVTDGAKAHIDISVAPQFLTYPGNNQHYETSDQSSFDLVFNSQTVHTFTLADFENGVTDQAFKNFSYDKDALGNDLIGVAGDDFIAIVSHGEQQNYTGFSVDHVVLQEWIV